MRRSVCGGHSLRAPWGQRIYPPASSLPRPAAGEGAVPPQAPRPSRPEGRLPGRDSGFSSWGKLSCLHALPGGLSHRGPSSPQPSLPPVRLRDPLFITSHLHAQPPLIGCSVSPSLPQRSYRNPPSPHTLHIKVKVTGAFSPAGTLRKQPKSGVIRLLKLVWLLVGGWRSWPPPCRESQSHRSPARGGSAPHPALTLGARGRSLGSPDPVTVPRPEH